MLKNNSKKIHQIYGWIVSVLVIALGVAFAVSALRLYLSDPTGDPYSRASIAALLKNLSILIYVTVAAIAGGFLLNLILPPERKKRKANRGAHANVKEIPANRLLMIRLGILVVSVVFIGIGVFNGSARDVLTKAIKICTECIGLG